MAKDDFYEDYIIYLCEMLLQTIGLVYALIKFYPTVILMCVSMSHTCALCRSG